ncbi:MAG: hypothetical protein JNL80_18795 [Phycisphaerae bacterium]|jgi:hypothetical protein|nr:hypothetical protein [Phycisphaerae bacterium]
MRTHSIRRLSYAAAGLLAVPAQASIVEFVSSPTTNSLDMAAWAAGLGISTIDTSVDFESHPEGEILPFFYPGVTLHGENVTVAFGEGSPSGSDARPLSRGEGPLSAFQGYTSNGSVQDGWSLTVTFDSPVFAAGFMTADVFDAFGDNGILLEAFDGEDGSGRVLGSFGSAPFNFELNSTYFMGVGDEEGRIKSVRISTAVVLYGDSQYVDGVLFAAKQVTSPCPADLNGDGEVSGADLGVLLGGWGSPGATDLDGSGSTGGADLAILLGAWGPCT